VAVGAGVVAGALVGVASIAAPATVAILALWGVGVTMSFPAPVYMVAFGAAVAAAVEFVLGEETRPLAVAIVLLAVAGLQPTVTQYNIPALIGMVILALGAPAAVSARRAERVSVPEAAGNLAAGHRTPQPAIEGAR